jgi:hypothetical protein
VEVYRLCVNVKLPEVDGHQAQEDFLVALKTVDSKYATACLREIYNKEQKGNKAGTYKSLEDYVAEVTTYLRRTQPLNTGLSTFAGDLKVSKVINNSKSTRSRKDCLCSKTH